jgi:hypothetical protein
MLCVLAFSAIAAQSAAAVTKGTTAFTCKAGAGTFKTEHCVPGETGGSFGHVAIASFTETRLRISNEKTNGGTNGSTSVKIKETVAGVPVELSASEVTGFGSLENRTAASGEHFVELRPSLEFNGVTVTKPAGKGCQVFEDIAKGEGLLGVIRSEFLGGTTEGQGDSIKLRPFAGTAFATFFITCTTKVEALEGTWELTGSFNCPTNGATIVCNHNEVTAQNTLKGKGAKAGFEGTLTLEGTDQTIGGDTYKPLSFTTVETP